ncbi:MAG: translation elongation factor Ts, partial [Clostridiales bacterium]|nr:translation elongation factor Ts [Clostridiales bacterium]
YISDDGKTGTVIEINCETDFVAKNPEFKKFVQQIGEYILQSDVQDVSSLLASPWKHGEFTTVEEALKGKIALYGENMRIRRFVKFSSGEGKFLQKYVHGETSSTTARIAVLTEIEGELSDTTLEAAKNICMQITVNRPEFVSKEEIPESRISEEREIIKEQTIKAEEDEAKQKKLMQITGLAVAHAARALRETNGNLNAALEQLIEKGLIEDAGKLEAAKKATSETLTAASSKPEQVILKIVEGKLAKRVKEICLLDQVYIKDSELNVAQYLDKFNKENGVSIKVTRFAAFEKGEGIEKKEDNFADEVNKMIG